MGGQGILWSALEAFGSAPAENPYVLAVSFELLDISNNMVFLIKHVRTVSLNKALYELEAMYIDWQMKESQDIGASELTRGGLHSAPATQMATTFPPSSSAVSHYNLQAKEALKSKHPAQCSYMAQLAGSLSPTPAMHPSHNHWNLHQVFAGRYLCEAEVLASSGHGGIQLLSELLIGFVLRKIKFCHNVRLCSVAGSRRRGDLRLKQVCELGSLSLLP